MNDEATVRDQTYSDFTNRIVKRVWGGSLSYHLTPYGKNHVTTNQILESWTGDGNCTAWARLFRDVLLAQGIGATRVNVTPILPDDLLLMKGCWVFHYPTSSGGTPAHPNVAPVDLENFLSGVPLDYPDAQLNSQPPHNFPFHDIVESGQIYYDPSYGTPKISGPNKKKVYEDRAFEGFGKLYPDQKLRARINNTTNDSERPKLQVTPNLQIISLPRFCVLCVPLRPNCLVPKPHPIHPVPNLPWKISGDE